MATFHFDLVSPERRVFSGEVDQVDVPGVEGDFGVLAGHAPLVATLRPGILAVHAQGEMQRYVLRGGFAEVNPDGLTVLADFAVSYDELDRADLAAAIKDLEEDVADTAAGPVHDRLARKLDQLRGVQLALER
jgi:F-type H+-transporting ATPase subunit epsilon